jgi:beta-lactamase regulating signal transducer with metallopeptidase domain
MIAGLLDHLWQSTLFTGGAGLLTLMLSRNPARLRFRLWFAASLKFLLPFAILSAAGEKLSLLFPASVPRLVLEIQPTAERLSAPARALAVQQHAGITAVPVLAAIWLAGFVAILGLRLLRWLRLHAMMRQARLLALAAPVDVKASASLLEPGLVGILNPVVLLPDGLMSRLSKAERDAILAHELSHLSRGDNVTAAIHMLVEALFWFYPPVWLIGARLIAERERACDESVLADGHDAEVYARGILKVCHFCVQSPLACASGASGADLGSRVRQIMSGDTVPDIHGAQRALLAGALVMALALPLAEGFVTAPRLIAAVRQRVAVMNFQVASRIVQAAAEARQIVTAPAPPVPPAPAKIRRLARLKVSPPPQEPTPQEQRMAAAEAPVAPPAPSAETSVAAAPPATADPPAPASAMAQPAHAVVKDVLVALYPLGDGDPDGMTCRSPEVLPGSRLPGPKVCQTNRQWASLRARHEDITPDGQGIIRPDGTEQQSGFAAINCVVGRVTGNGITNVLSVPASVCF